MRSKQAKIAELKEGKESAVYGKVVRTFETPISPVFTLMDDTGHVDVSFREPFLPGDFVYARGIASRKGDGFILNADYAEKLSGKRAGSLEMVLAPALEKLSAPLEADLLIEDKVTLALEQKFGQAASMILRALHLLRPITIRFHGDTDGICGAQCIRKAMKEIKPFAENIAFHQNPSATYMTVDALRDVRNARAYPEYTLPPLFILIDFSSNNESLEAVKVIKTAEYELLIIDHHPPQEEVAREADLLVSPWGAAGNSDYTAGLLCGEIAKRMAKVNVDELQKTALIGDKSPLAFKSAPLLKKSIVLDFLSSNKKLPDSLEFYMETLEDKHAFSPYYDKAISRVNNVKKAAREIAKKKQVNGFTVFTVRMDKILTLGEYPPKGRATTAAHEELSDPSLPCITLGLGGGSVVIRANEKAQKKGFDASKLIAEIDEELKNALIGGGGHARAASMRAKPGFANISLDELLKKIELIGKVK